MKRVRMLRGGPARLAVLVGLAVLGSARSTQACFIKSHHWRLPLGEADAGVVVLDLPMHTEEKMVRCTLGQRGCYPDPFGRHSRKAARHGERLSVSWKGSPALALFTRNGQALTTLSRLRPPEKMMKGLEPDRGPLLARALTAATGLRGFRPYPLPNQDYCDYRRACGRYELLSDDKGAVSVAVDIPGLGKLARPVLLPESFLRRMGDGPVDPDDLRALRIISVLSYPNAKGELLVLDIGTGDEVLGAGQAAIYPPCGCTDILRCPPWPDTLHHGDQIQLVVQIPFAPPPRSAAEVPTRPPLTDADLVAAAEHPAWTPAWDGIYATAPACEGKDWSRTFLRFFRDGKAALIEGNYSPADAARLIASSSAPRSPAPCEVRGERLRCALVEGDDDESSPSLMIEGRRDREWLDIRVLGVKSPPAFHSLSWNAIEKEILTELDKR